MKRLSSVLFAAGALLALATVAAGCGDDSDRRAREYFEEIVEIASRHTGEAEAAQAAYDVVVAANEGDNEGDIVAASVGEEEEVAAFLRMLDISSKSIRAETADREKVDPPPVVEEAHLDMLAAARLVAKVYEDAFEGASDATTVAELEEALQAVDYGPRLEEVQDRVEKACTRFQALANESGIETQVC